MIERRHVGRRLVALAVLFLAATGRAAHSSAEQSRMEHVIVPAERGADYDRGNYGAAMGPHWTPTPAQVRELEARLPAYLAQAAPAGSQLRQGLAGYRAQYVGIVRDGRQVIFANCFCRALGGDWRQAPIIVDDGGDCFFQVEYDPATAAFSHLMVNGTG